VNATPYDTIGRSYSATRRPDPRIAEQIRTALGSAATVVNIGAGSGNYEPDDCDVVAVEPSMVMLQQRAANAAPAVRGIAEALPFADRSFDVALAVLTMHHWTDLERGLREMMRVASRQVVFYFEPIFGGTLWLVKDYFPQMLELGTEQRAPDCERLARTLDVQTTEVVMVPGDCADGFGGCFWNRPEVYLDPRVQDGMSSFAQLDPEIRARGTDRLRHDLESGAWDARYGSLRTQTEIDLGYRLLSAGLP
jgi:SAM-dependent methyltransferase